MNTAREEKGSSSISLPNLVEVLKSEFILVKRQISKFYPRTEGSNFLGVDPGKLYFKQLPQVIPAVKHFCQVLHFVLTSGVLLGL